MFYLTTHSTYFIYGYMVKDHSASERGYPLPPHGLLFPINSKGSFICLLHQRRGALAGLRNRSVDPSYHERITHTITVSLSCYLYGHNGGTVV